MRIPLPDDAYLQRLGTFAYAITYIEGGLVLDVPRLQSVLPAELTVEALAGKTTGQIGRFLLEHAAAITDPDVARYFRRGGEALVELSDQRNHALHARPATIDGLQRLHRWRPPHVFDITDDWFEKQYIRIDELAGELSVLRPSLTAWPP